MKKKDGRKNNGGARPGAGRPRKKQYEIYDDDWQTADRLLEGEVVVLERRLGQMRRVKVPRYQKLIDLYMKWGLPFAKGHKRDFNEFISIILDTPFEDVYEERREYLEEAIQKAKFHIRERQEAREKKKGKPLTPSEKANLESQRIYDEIQGQIKKQEAANWIAVDRHLREKERHHRN